MIHYQNENFMFILDVIVVILRVGLPQNLGKTFKNCGNPTRRIITLRCQSVVHT